MCGTCGCSDHSKHHHHDHDHDHEHHHHDHAHDHEHHHHHHDAEQERIAVEIELLSKNNLIAERNRGYFEAKEICAFNMMSSPGSGKTTLLEKTVSMLKDKLSICVVEGDQQTTNDADRIKAAGAKAIQINTGTGCHLEAEMVNNAVKELKPADKSLLFIENVGNLVCPAMFDLGEKYKVVVVSTTEGDDKPLKYPQMFYKADICVINKIDLAPYLKTNIEILKSNILKVNHHLQIFEVSAESGAGMDKWCSFLAEQVK
ncbi:MAG: hydrogenase nickel incorporation protein HypB [Tannerellaceae bacterium]